MNIVTVRMHGDDDYSGVQMISGKRLAHLHRVEALAKELVRELCQPVAPDAPEAQAPDADRM